MFNIDTYVQRRQRLARLLPGELLLFIGNELPPFNYDGNEYRFRQDSTFLYLFGLDTPHLAAIIDTDNGTETLFADDVSMDDIVWTGPMPSAAETAASTGINNAQPYAALFSTIDRALKAGRRINFISPYRGETIILLSQLLNIQPAQVKSAASEPLMRALVQMRSVKEQCEIDDMEAQMAFGANMHLTAMHMAIDGTTENDIMARMEMEALRGGGPVSFPSICTVHGETLHNHGYRNTLRNGQLLLVDAGCESANHYATDNTRTTPVDGRFSLKQKEIYQVVLDANNAVAQAAKPGILYKDMHLLAARTIVDGLKNVGLMKGDTDEAVSEGAYALFMPHGIGHMLGLDVHDMQNYGEDLVGYDSEVQRSAQFGLSSLRLARRLQQGFCVTDEPGIYFIPELIERWQSAHLHDNFINYSRLNTYKSFGGIRIEDDLLITANGARVLGTRLPAEAADVEAEVLRGYREVRDVFTL